MTPGSILGGLGQAERLNSVATRPTPPTLAPPTTGGATLFTRTNASEAMIGNAVTTNAAWNACC